MLRCQIIDFLYAIVPLKIRRDFLFRRHIEKCPFCQAKLASREVAKSLMLTENDISVQPSLWPQVKARLMTPKEDRLKEKQLRGQKRWRWAAAAAGLLIVGLTSFWLFKDFRPDKNRTGKEATERFRINYIRVEDQPAQAYLYQPSESDLIIIWIQKSP